ncbi:MAG: hypothetical protein D6781_10655 [Verrucomicrobia bacterium]|nr:MAG: hypothetical protein D6781_10655 [Verrucomicrobiota bacterium]
MNWETLAPIIAREGLLVAMRLWQLHQSGAAVSQQQWDELLRLARKTYADYLAEAAADHGGTPRA